MASRSFILVIISLLHNGDSQLQIISIPYLTLRRSLTTIEINMLKKGRLAQGIWYTDPPVPNSNAGTFRSHSAIDQRHHEQDSILSGFGRRVSSFSSSEADTAGLRNASLSKMWFVAFSFKIYCYYWGSFQKQDLLLAALPILYYDIDVFYFYLLFFIAWHVY